ncbi:hypothetical protein CDEST_13897 [Colletotrichum destructivum]|uniref:Uncharacterized protein n=1 Tax=Colletotrichum destructivum TaxID=34406 RepID=A0AAX4J0D9_9PEZI|nr:hypothetical protein CDEST_13897 [Colletotrichum destructivum]
MEKDGEIRVDLPRKPITQRARVVVATPEARRCSQLGRILASAYINIRTAETLPSGGVQSLSRIVLRAPRQAAQARGHNTATGAHQQRRRGFAVVQVDAHGIMRWNGSWFRRQPMGNASLGIRAAAGSQDEL